MTDRTDVFISSPRADGCYYSEDARTPADAGPWYENWRSAITDARYPTVYPPVQASAQSTELQLAAERCRRGVEAIRRSQQPADGGLPSYWRLALFLAGSVAGSLASRFLHK